MSDVRKLYPAVAVYSNGMSRPPTDDEFVTAGFTREMYLNALHNYHRTSMFDTLAGFLAEATGRAALHKLTVDEVLLMHGGDLAGAAKLMQERTGCDKATALASCARVTERMGGRP